MIYELERRAKAIKLEHIKATSSGFFELSGGYRMKVKAYSDQNTNGLTAAVCAWLTYNGHYCNRINSQGQVRIEKIETYGGRYIDKVRYTKGTSNKGTADIDSIINGRPVKIEIKCKATVIQSRKDQTAEKERVEAAGGVYLIVTDMPQFVQWYKQFVGSTPVLSK